MAKLCQIIALEKGIKSQTYSLLTQKNKLLQKPDLFAGFSKQYQRLNEEGEELPAEQKRVQFRVDDVLDDTRAALIDYWQMTARKEWSNTAARADVVVDGQTLLEQVPVPYLLFLEKQLTDLRTFCENIPTLSMDDDWTHDDNTALYKTAPVQTHRTKKMQRPLVLYEATKEHPAQTQLVTEDILAGYWHTIKHSGAMPQPRKHELAVRVEAVLRAVKAAREAANSHEEVTVPPVAGALCTYLFGKR